eukprot:CAMPEP_0181466766 /NCGR_PEP_ID=MMETSP1110-20121109/36629_1 /TAXON_ID=174948 /ORGANISM="Symbiodinium sp., Strain CCMP421" /LENGTH=226 /DNA_ID=CAMNT_0023591565 /DNA_START=276 /DNA_END=956 /DNA_ORIENTATION=-
MRASAFVCLDNAKLRVLLRGRAQMTVHVLAAPLDLVSGPLQPPVAAAALAIKVRGDRAILPSAELRLSRGHVNQGLQRGVHRVTGEALYGAAPAVQAKTPGVTRKAAYIGRNPLAADSRILTAVVQLQVAPLQSFIPGSCSTVEARLPQVQGVAGIQGLRAEKWHQRADQDHGGKHAQHDQARYEAHQLPQLDFGELRRRLQPGILIASLGAQRFGAGDGDIGLGA